MAFLKIILTLILLTPVFMLYSGCGDDKFLEAIHAEEDFIAPFDVVLSDAEDTRTVYFPVTDTGNINAQHDGDDAFYTDIPLARSFTESDVNGEHIVTDNVTGLVWTKCTADGFKSMKADCSAPTNLPDSEMSWTEAYETCKSFRTTKFAGLDNWRLPSLPELASLLYFNGTSYADLTTFPDTEINPIDDPSSPYYSYNAFYNIYIYPLPAYWTFTSRVLTGSSFSVTDYGWVVYFNYGPSTISSFQLTSYIEKIPPSTGTVTPNKAFVRCVSGGRGLE